MATTTAAKWVRKDDLQAYWKTSKTEAEKKAKALGQSDQLKKLQKDKLSENLQDTLGAWVKAYPNITKLEDGKKKIEKILANYGVAIKECKTIADDVKKPMLSAIANMKVKLGNQFDDAKLSALGANASAVAKLGAPQMQGLGPGKTLQSASRK